MEEDLNLNDAAIQCHCVVPRNQIGSVEPPDLGFPSEDHFHPVTGCFQAVAAPGGDC